MPRLAWPEFLVPNGGIDESMSPQKIADNKWSSAVNAEPMADGVRRRNGCAESNATALSGGVQMIADFHDSNGSTVRHLVIADGKLYKNVGGTMTEIVHAGGALATDDDTHPSWAVGNDRVFMTDDAAVSRKFVIINATDLWVNESLGAPTDIPTLGTAADSDNALDTGTWAVDYYFWDNDLGVPSARKYEGSDNISTDISSTDTVLTVSDLPTDVERTGDRATHIRIETKGPAQTIFRLHKTIALGVSSATITATDKQTLEAEYGHGPPPVHLVKAFAENRQFILNVADAPYRLMFSSIIGTTPHYESYPATNRRDFGKGDGDYGTALFFVPPRTLVVGFRNSIWAIDPRAPLTSDRFLISRNIGIANWDAGIVVGRSLFFISDAESNKGPHVWTPGSDPQYVSGLDDTFKNLNLARLKYTSCANYAPGEERFQWWTLVSAAAATEHDQALVFDRRLGAWTRFSLTQKGSVLGEVEVAGAGQLFMGSTDGKEYQRDSTSQDNGTDFRGTVQLKAFDFGQPGINKRMRFVDALLAEQSTGGLSVTIERDYQDKTAISVPLDQVGPSASFVLGTSELGIVDPTDTQPVLGGRSDVFRRSRARGRAKVFRPTLSASTSWHVKGVTFGLQPTGKR